MKSTLLSLIVLVLFAMGCDTQTPFVRDDSRDVAKFTVSYTVEGTYASCRLLFVKEDRSTENLADVTLPWSTSFPVTIRKGGAPFGASIHATCTDPDKFGKSTAAIFVNNTMKDRGATTGRGETSKALYFITLDDKP